MQSKSKTEVEFRPFHETIVEDILTATNEELIFIASQLKKSLIPANHEEIIRAWHHRRKWMRWADEDDLGVPASLLWQKEAAEEKAARQSKQVGIELHGLQEAMEAFLATSHNHHLSGNGSMVSWHTRLRGQLEKLHQLTTRALGKK